MEDFSLSRSLIILLLKQTQLSKLSKDHQLGIAKSEETSLVFWFFALAFPSVLKLLKRENSLRICESAWGASGSPTLLRDPSLCSSHTHGAGTHQPPARRKSGVQRPRSALWPCSVLQASPTWRDPHALAALLLAAGPCPDHSYSAPSPEAQGGSAICPESTHPHGDTGIQTRTCPAVRQALAHNLGALMERVAAKP